MVKNVYYTITYPGFFSLKLLATCSFNIPMVLVHMVYNWHHVDLVAVFKFKAAVLEKLSFNVKRALGFFKTNHRSRQSH